MLHHPTVDQLLLLRLTGMTQALASQTQQTDVNGGLKLTQFATKQRFKTATPQMRMLRGLCVLDGEPKAKPERCLGHAAINPPPPLSSPEPCRLDADV